MVTTVCGYCGVGCRLEHNTAEPENRTVLPFEKGMVCSKGSSSMESVALASRLKTPCILNDGFEPVSWDAAISTIVEKIKAAPPHRIGLYLSGQLLTEDYYVANKLGKGFIGTNNVDTNSRMCMSSAVVAYKKVFGVDYVPVRMDDLRSCDLLILAGANTAEAHVVLNNRIKKEKKRGLKTVVIDPRRTTTAEQADLHLQIRPGTDIDLLNLVAQRLIRDGKCDKTFIKEHIEGFESYRAEMEKLDPSLLHERCGVDAQQFETFMQLLYANENIISAWTMGLNQSVQGVDKNLALINLHLLTGKVNRAGNGPFSLTGQPNAMGGREVGGLSSMLAVHLDFDEEAIEKVSAFWDTDRIDPAPGMTAFEMIEAAERGELDLLIISHTDPVYHLPNRHRVEEALKKVPFIVEINAYDDSETKPFAHLRLPAAPWGEKEGTQTNLDRTVTRQEKLAAPRFDARPDWQIFAMIGERLGFSEAFHYGSAEEVFEEFKAMTKLSRDAHLDIYGLDPSTLREEPYVWGKELFSDHRYHTPTGRANLFFVENNSLSEQTGPDYPFTLLTGRIRDQWHSGTKTAHVAKLHKHKPLSFVEVNIDDAAALGIADGDDVTVTTHRGLLTLKARVTDAIQQKVLFIPVTERRLNYLTNDLLDPLSKEPDFNHSAAALSKGR